MDTQKTKVGFRNPEIAFNNAVAKGTLSEVKGCANYAGNYMYMHTDIFGRDFFKNSETRKYLDGVENSLEGIEWHEW
jgi:hypothetical protein